MNQLLDNLEALEQIARQATQGKYISTDGWDVSIDKSDPKFICNLPLYIGRYSHNFDASYAVAFNPATVLELIAEIHKLRKGVELTLDGLIYIRQRGYPGAEFVAGLTIGQLDALLAGK